MKKVLSIIALLIIGMVASAQETAKAELETVDMNRTFSVGGKAIMCLRSKEASKKSLQALEWTLKNDRIGDTNIVVLDVKTAKDGSTVAHQSWSDGVMVRMKVKDKKPVVYEVYDDMFSHLRIVDVDLGWIILFYSEMIN
jgi:hypothetical protein